MALKQWVLKPLYEPVFSFYILMVTHVRFASMVAFGVMSYQYIQKKPTVWAITFGALVLLFQPFIKVALGRTIWNVVDVIVAVLLIVLWVKEIRKNHGVD